MKRFIGALLLTLGLIVPPLQVAEVASAEVVKGNACRDIDTDTFYTSVGFGEPTAVSTITTAKPSCSNVTYSLRAYSTDGTLQAETSQVGNGESTFTLTVAAPGEPAVVNGINRTVVCLSITSDAGNKVVDQAPDGPDRECFIGAYFILDGGSGGRPMG